MELGLPQAFDPNDSNGKPLKYAPFVHSSGEKSVEFTSAAGITIIETHDGYSTPLMGAAASGTERTVEGVANAILRVLLLKDMTGEAAVPEEAYLNPVDGQVYCDKKTADSFQKHFRFQCHRIESHLPDRSVMIAEKIINRPRKTFAMTQYGGEYNYAVGY